MWELPHCAVIGVKQALVSFGTQDMPEHVVKLGTF